MIFEEVLKMLSEIELNPPSSVKQFARPTEALERYRTLYRDITANGVKIEYSHRHALGELAVMMVEVQLLREQLYDDGNTDAMQVQGDRNIITKKNPARDALEKIRTPMLRLMKEFNMTPGSNSKKQYKMPGEKESNEDKEFSNF